MSPAAAEVASAWSAPGPAVVVGAVVAGCAVVVAAGGAVVARGGGTVVAALWLPQPAARTGSTSRASAGFLIVRRRPGRGPPSRLPARRPDPGGPSRSPSSRAGRGARAGAAGRRAASARPCGGESRG